MTSTRERLARRLAGHYGPDFDDCLPNRRAVKDAALKGEADINDNDQAGHLEAVDAILNELMEPGAWALEAGAKAGRFECGVNDFVSEEAELIYRAILTHIRNSHD